MEINKTLQVLASILIWAAILLAGMIPLVFWPNPVSTNYPLVLIYLVPKTIVLRLGVMILEYAAVLLLLAGAALSAYRKEIKIKISWVDAAIAAFIGLVWLSSQRSLNADRAFYGSGFWLEGFYTYANYIAIFFVARIFGRAKSLINLSYALIVTTIIISIYAIVEAFYPALQAFTNVGLTARSGATAGNAVILGAYIVMPLALIGGLFVQKTYKGVWAILAGVALWLGTVAAFFTYSRASWAALALVAIALAWRAKALRVTLNRKQVAGAGVAILMALTVMAIGPRPPRTTVARAFSAFNPSEPSVQSRLKAWGQAGRMIIKYPLWGTGIDSFSEGVVLSEPHTRPAPMDKPHNFFLEITATMGIPAFAAFVAWLGLIAYAGAMTVRASAPGNKDVVVALAALGGYLLAVFFLFSTINNAPLFYLIAGLTAAAARDAGTLPLIVNWKSRGDASG